jgi:anaerobic ribonucleoside-triphosphate reductase
MNYIESKTSSSIAVKIPAEVYSRVSGYFRPVDQWNKAKQEEFKTRKFTSTEMIGHYLKT